MIRYRSALMVAVVACGMAPAAAYAEDVSATPTTSPSPPPMQYPFVALSPTKSIPGEEILVSVGCPVADLGEVKSMALDRIAKFEVTSEDPVILGAVAHIGDKMRPGFYAVKATCKTTTVTINLEVVALPTSSGKPPKPKPTPPKTSSVSPVKPAAGRQVSKIPVGAPQTGGGGTTL